MGSSLSRNGHLCSWDVTDGQPKTFNHGGGAARSHEARRWRSFRLVLSCHMSRSPLTAAASSQPFCWKQQLAAVGEEDEGSRERKGSVTGGRGADDPWGQLSFVGLHRTAMKSRQSQMADRRPPRCVFMMRYGSQDSSQQLYDGDGGRTWPRAPLRAQFNQQRCDGRVWR